MKCGGKAVSDALWRSRFLLTLAGGCGHIPSSRALCVLIIALPLAGCITDRDNAGAPPKIAPLPPPSERGTSLETASAREHKRLVASLGGEMRAPAVERIASDVTARLASAAASEGGPGTYRLTLLNSPSVNAFALPTGDMYVTRGLLALANDTSELAAVLAHEMAHVTANHAGSRQERELRSALVSRVVANILNDTSSSEALQTQSRADLAGFSRAQELEADRIGIRILAKAGFDPYGAVRFLNSLGRNAASRAALVGEQGTRPDFLSTHPSTPERISLAMTSARQVSAPGLGDSDRTRYLAALDGLSYGDDPAGGVVRGRRYLNPTLGMTFTAPDGYVMEVGSQAVIGIMPAGNQALRFDRLDAEGGTPEQAISSGWIDGVKIEAIEPMTVNGLTGATAIGRGEDWTFRFVAIRKDNSLYRLIFAARNGFAEADKGFRATMMSVRALTQDEVSRIVPLRVRILTAQPGDTAESMATRMSGVDRPFERFLILNGLERGRALTPGQGYKIVTD